MKEIIDSLFHNLYASLVQDAAILLRGIQRARSSSWMPIFYVAGSFGGESLTVEEERRKEGKKERGREGTALGEEGQPSHKFNNYHPVL